jgi:hypothetical protein
MTAVADPAISQMQAPHDASDEGRRATDDRVALAIDLGWRMAELFALNVEYEPVERTCHLLPARGSFSRHDRLELELLAAAGTVQRLGVDLQQERIVELCELAQHSAARDGADARFRDELERCHVTLDKALWMRSEAEGRAYELGIMLSDTYNRIFRVYHEQPDAPEREWLEVFGKPRVQVLLTLLGNLQSRLDPTAAAVVRDHLNTWRERVHGALAEGTEARAPSEAASGELRSQTIVWRQLLTGDKEPEAFLGPEARARVRDELLHLMWQRYWAGAVALSAALAAVLAAVLVWHVDVAHLYSDDRSGRAALVTSGLLSVAGAFGITKASINRAVKHDLRVWSRLLWNRALARVVCTETLRLNDVFPLRPSRRKRALLTLAARAPVATMSNRPHTPQPT